MGLIDDLAAALGGALTVTEGIVPTERHPGLRQAAGSILPSFGTGPSHGSNERFAPNYILNVNGVVLPEVLTRRITSVTYEDNEELFDTLTITLEGFIPVSDSENLFGVDVPKAARDVPIPTYIVDEPWFSEGNVIRVDMGYGGVLQTIGAAQVVKREFNYGDVPSCTIVCYEPLHLMAANEPEKAITYTGMLSSSIVKLIGRKSDYTATKIGALFDVSEIQRLPAFTPRSEVQKKGESDWAFLKRLADVRGWQLFTRFEPSGEFGRFKLFYGPDVDKQQTVFRYEYHNKLAYPEDSLLSFTPEINIIDQNSSVEITSTDDTRKQPIASKSEVDALADGAFPVNRKLSAGQPGFDKTELQNPQSYRIVAFGASVGFTTTRPFKSEKEVKQFVINLAREKIKHFITGRANVAGNEGLQSRQVMLLSGLGVTFSGTESKPANWYITKCVHKMSGSAGNLVYMNELQLRKAVNFLPADGLSTDLLTSSANIGF